MKRKSQKRNKKFLNIQTFWVYIILLVILVITISVIELYSENLAGEAKRGGSGEGGVTFALAFANPGALSQPTALGKRIHTLESFDGKVFSGYGDFGANTGPIDIYSYDAATGALVKEFTFQTESIEQLQVWNGILYAPAIDPTGYGAHYALRPATSIWQEKSNLGSVAHAFDIEVFDNNLYIAGSSGNNAVIWRSADNGQTWQKVLNVPPLQGFARFYMIFALNGKLYAQAVDSVWVGLRASWTSLDGVIWENNGPDLLQPGEFGHDPRKMLNGVVYRSRPYNVGGLEFFDGTKTTSIASNLGGVGGHTVSPGGRLYIVTWDRKVFRTSDLTNWQSIGTIKGRKSQGSSIVVHDKKIYVGLSTGEIYSAPEPA